MIPRVSEAFSQSRHAFKERDFTIRCEPCAQEWNLSECTTRVTSEARTYRCPRCTLLLVVVGYPAERNVSGANCRPGTWLSVHSAADLHVQLQGSRLSIAPSEKRRIYGEPLL